MLVVLSNRLYSSPCAERTVAVISHARSTLDCLIGNVADRRFKRVSDLRTGFGLTWLVSGCCGEVDRERACRGGRKSRGEWLHAIQSGEAPERGFKSHQVALSLSNNWNAA